MRVMTIGTVMVDVLAVGLPGIARPGEVVYVPHPIETRIGGHPVDVAIDMAALGHPTSEVAVVAAVGEGPFGRFVRGEMERFDVTAFLQNVSDLDTGKNLVLEATGEDRRFHLDPGANWVLDADHIVAVLESWTPDVVSIRPGYTGIDLQLEHLMGHMDDAIVLLDIMQPHPSRPARFLDAAIRRAQIVHCNEIEARVATGQRTIEAAVRGFLEDGVRIVFVTSGKEGATAYTPTHTIRQRGFVVDTVDATGCGDAFCAGVLLALGDRGGPKKMPALEPTDVSKLLLNGQAVGASAATAAGCVDGVAAEVVALLLAEQGDAISGETEIIEHHLI